MSSESVPPFTQNDDRTITPTADKTIVRLKEIIKIYEKLIKEDLKHIFVLNSEFMNKYNEAKKLYKSNLATKQYTTNTKEYIDLTILYETIKFEEALKEVILNSILNNPLLLSKENENTIKILLDELDKKGILLKHPQQSLLIRLMQIYMMIKLES